ncbi:MAG: phosphoenolpyruvate carboxylase [Planctomycetota bacterium]|nr:MAG: phosphoenolpyruvate carboxylase [Planctomycetota bacterium]
MAVVDRWGGVADRPQVSILSLPPGSVDGALRLTEQGEVLADKYDDPAIAHRHLELVMWSALIVSGSPPATAAPSGARRCRRFRRGRSRPIASFSTNRASSTFFAV